MYLFWSLLFSVRLLQSPIAVESTNVPLPANGLYRTAEDFVQRRLSHGFNQAADTCHWQPTKSAFRPTQLQTADSLLTVDEQHDWGFRWQGTDYRLVNGQCYQVIDADGIVLYELDDPWGMDGGGTTFYFSRSAWSDLHFLNRKELLSTFADDSTVLARLKSVPWPYGWLHQSAQSRHTKLVDLCSRK